MEKTLGQIYHDAQWPQYDYENADKWCNEREAAGIAAVARHVFGEMLAAHVAECHKPQPGPNAWAARPWEMSEKPLPPPTPPAATGDDELDDMTNEEADAAYDAAEPIPMSDVEINRIVAYVTSRTRLDELASDCQFWRQQSIGLKRRAESAEAALGELKEACKWADRANCSPTFCVNDGKWYSDYLPKCGIFANTRLDAILAAYRATKAASVAAEGVVTG